MAILYYLLSGPARTATECAAEVGGTASACSYHLRELERFGLVERVESSGDARMRPWRARSASDFHTYELMVTPTELNELNSKVGELLRTYRAPTRADVPEGAQAVHVIYQAFPRLPAS